VTDIFPQQAAGNSVEKRVSTDKRTSNTVHVTAIFKAKQRRLAQLTTQAAAHIHPFYQTIGT